MKQLDSPSLRALAHPLRVRILGALRSEGPATATMLGERLGESSGATSYHLRVLAAHGFVAEDTTRGTARERWWEASAEMTSWRSEQFADDPEERAADQWLVGFHARTAMEWIDAWLERRATVEPAWLAAGELSDYFAVMTAPQVRALTAELHAAVLRHVDAAAEASAAGDADQAETRMVRFLVAALPAEARAPGSPPAAAAGEDTAPPGGTTPDAPPPGEAGRDTPPGGTGRDTSPPREASS